METIGRLGQDVIDGLLYVRYAKSEEWASLFSILDARVRPVRAGNKQRNYRKDWWQHANRVPEAAAYSKIYGQIIAFASVSSHLSVAFARTGTILANSMHLILLHEHADLALLQSRIHETWARFLGSSMKDDLRYTTPCFDTFPRPNPSDRSAMERVGRESDEFRAQVMRRNDEGLTATYNRFHDPDECSPDILKLRELHAAMDRAVLDAYGWTDLRPTCEFLLDYEEDDEDESRGRLRFRPPPQEALALPLARRVPRRGPRPPPGTQPPARRAGAPERCRRRRQGEETEKNPPESPRRGATRSVLTPPPIPRRPLLGTGLGSFGEDAFRETRLVISSYPLQGAIGFVRRNANSIRSGRTAPGDHAPGSAGFVRGNGRWLRSGRLGGAGRRRFPNDTRWNWCCVRSRKRLVDGFMPSASHHPSQGPVGFVWRGGTGFAWRGGIGFVRRGRIGFVRRGGTGFVRRPEAACGARPT